MRLISNFFQKINPVKYISGYGIFRLALASSVTIIFSLAIGSAVAKGSSNSNYHFDDWVSENCGTSIFDCGNVCGGYYREPNYKYPISSFPEDYPIEISSDEGRFEDRGASTFIGKVVSKQGNRTLVSDKATILQDKATGALDKIYADGNIILTEPGIRVDGDSLTVDNKDNSKTVKNAKYRFYPGHLRGESCSLRAVGKNLIYLPNGSFTTCAPYSNSWYLKASEIKLNKESGRGEAWHSKLYVKDIPVFYWPYVNFPIDNKRKTGFLFPDFQTTSNYGPTIKLPFYWNIAPNYDATITPYISAKRNFRLFNEFRYLTDSSTGKILIDYLPDDKEYKKWRTKVHNSSNVTGLRLSAAKKLSSRYAFAISNKTLITKNFDFEVDYTRLGDDNLLQQIGPKILQSNKSTISTSNAINALQANVNSSNISSSTTAILQKFIAQYRSNIGTLTYAMQQYQILHPYKGAEGTEQYRKLPELSFYSRRFDISDAAYFNINSSYTSFKKRPNGSLERDSYGKRFYARPVLAYNISESGYFIKPKAKLHHVNYDLKLNSADISSNKPNSPSRTIPVFDLDSGLIFERELSVFNAEYIQTLEPRAYFLYAPNRAQEDLPIFDSGTLSFSYDQLFRDNRYSGFDRQSEASQVALSITTKFLENSDGEEKASFSIGQLFYFQDRVIRTSLGEATDNVRNKYHRSPIAAKLKYNIVSAWDIESNIAWDEPAGRIDLASIAIQYNPSDYNVTNFGYTFDRNNAIDVVTNRRNHTKQFHLSSAWFVTDKIRAIGKIQYNLNRKTFSNIATGLEYYGCCINLRAYAGKRLTAATTLQSKRKFDNEVGFQIVFKGFAGVGNTDASAIGAGIPGYSSPKDNKF